MSGASRWFSRAAGLLGLAILVPVAAIAAVDRTIYADSLAAGWEDWSYSATLDFASAQPVHAGVAAISVAFTDAYGGLSLRISPPLATAGFNAIRFWIFGGAGGTAIDVYTQTMDTGGESPLHPVTAPAGVWTQITVPLATFGSPAQIARITLQDRSGAAGGPSFSVDDVALVASAGSGFPDPTATRVLGQDDFVSSGDGITASTLHGPAGVAVGPDDRLFVVDFYNHRVLSWPSATGFANGAAADLVLGQASFTSNETSAAANRMNLPESVAVDPAGNVFVSDTYNHRVLLFAPPLATDMNAVAFGSEGCVVPTPDTLCFPRGIASDALGNLYLADEFHDRVLIYRTPAASGDYTPDVFVAGLGEPRGVAVDADGTLFATDSEADRVLHYLSPLTTDAAPDGDPIGVGADGKTCEEDNAGIAVTGTQLACPIDLAIDGSGSLFVSDLFNHRILAYADPLAGGAPDTVYGQQGSLTSGDANRGGLGAQSMSTPLGLAFDASGGLYLADFENNRVLAYPAPVPEPGPVASALAALALLCALRGRGPRSPSR